MILMQPNSTVAPGDSTSFTIKFDPSSVGIKTDTISINSDDGDENPYKFVITGKGVDITYSSQAKLNFSDPCSCTDPLNCTQGGLYYFHDTLTVNTMPATAGLSLKLDGLSSNIYTGVCGSLVLANGAIIPESVTEPGVYKLEFWRPSGSTPSASVIVNGGSSQVVPPDVFLPVYDVIACQAAPMPNIPTLDQWGVLLLGLIMVIMAMVGIRQKSFLQSF
jgi:hypothetical protein